jgi:uncharacterized membrane protein YphA (DoxX/SURF4 family)
VTEPREPETPPTEGAPSVSESIVGDGASTDAGLVAPPMPQIPTMPSATVSENAVSEDADESLPTVTVPLVVPVIPVLADSGEGASAAALSEPEAVSDSEPVTQPVVAVGEPVAQAEATVAPLPGAPLPGAPLPGAPLVAPAVPTESVPEESVEPVSVEPVAVEVSPAAADLEPVEASPAVVDPVISAPLPATPLPSAPLPDVPQAAAVVTPQEEPVSADSQSVAAATLSTPSEPVEPAVVETSAITTDPGSTEVPVTQPVPSVPAGDTPAADGAGTDVALSGVALPGVPVEPVSVESQAAAEEVPAVSLPGAPVMPAAPAVSVTPLPAVPEAPAVQMAAEPVSAEPVNAEAVNEGSVLPESAYPIAMESTGGAYAELVASEERAVTEEERKLAAERAARRDARAAAFTSEIQPEPTAPVAAQRAAEPKAAVKKATDGFWASAGLFLVRLVLAAIFGVRGVQMLMEPAKTQTMLEKTIVPSTMISIAVTVAGVACLLVALAMVFGLATRAAGLGAAVITGSALALVYWGASFSIFRDFNPTTLEFGFWGEEQLLIAVVGLLILFVGAGGWSIDRSLRVSRQRNKAAK